MRIAKNDKRGTAGGAILLVLLALALPLGAEGAVGGTGAPRVATGTVSHVHGTSGQLLATVNPHGLETTYFFQYGPTLAYGSLTPTLPVGSGIITVKLSQPVSGLLVGYHYRVVASNSAGQTLGRDRVFAPHANANKIEIPKEARVDVFGSPFLVTGRLTGLVVGGRKLVLQSSPFPYLEPFVTISAPATTNSLGAFSFRVTNLFQSAQLRVATLDPRPLYSSVLTEHVAVKVSFHVRSSGQPGLVRIYGTVKPAGLVGALVRLQLAKAVRPGRSERGTHFSTQFTTRVKRATSTFSRFSTVVKVRHSGNYRVLVEPKPGPIAPGSSPHLPLKAAPGSKKG
ncbi:MAG: hypothetical protein H0X28_13470 [Solirubrobacterales bacterium]|nr:hypothetical protein [Solirubrobacterales bacterium]